MTHRGEDGMAKPPFVGLAPFLEDNAALLLRSRRRPGCDHVEYDRRAVDRAVRAQRLR